MKVYHIYKITNIINNKVYIGQTSQSKPRERFTRHIRESRRGSEGFLYNAIRKYGEQNFKFDLLICCLDFEICNELEIEFISNYNSINHEKGYNLLIGGNQAPMMEETKLKLSETIKQQYQNGRKSWNSGMGGKNLYSLPSPWNTGKKGQYKIGHGDNVSKALKGIPKSEEHRKKLSEAKKKYNAENIHVQAKPVRCKETGMVFRSVTKAANYFGAKNGTKIGQVCRGERKHYKNLTFEYVE